MFVLDMYVLRSISFDTNIGTTLYITLESTFNRQFSLPNTVLVVFVMRACIVHLSCSHRKMHVIASIPCFVVTYNVRLSSGPMRKIR